MSKSPQIQIVIDKTRELLSATPDTVVARVARRANQTGLDHVTNDKVKKDLEETRELYGMMSDSEIAVVFKDDIDRVCKSAMNDKMIAAFLQSVTMGIMEMAKVQ